MNFKLLLIIAITTALVACGGADERKAVYMEKAKSSIEAGDFDKARIELKNVLQIDPKDAEAYYQLGKVFEQQKEYRSAYGNYLKAEELNPELLQNHARLGRFYLLLMNDTDKAQEKIDLILSKEPDNSDGLLLKAAVMLRKDNMDEAVKIAKSIIEKDQGNVEAAAFLATLYVRENKDSDAINVLETALKVKPDDIQLSYLLAQILVKNKDYERAELIYKKFLEQKPDSSSSYNTLAAFYGQTGDKVKAEATLRAAIENDPKDVDRQLTLVKYIREIKSNDEAIKELNNFIAQNGSLGKLRLALAELLYMNGDKESSIAVYKKAINDFSEEVTGVQSRITLATIYINDKDFANAKIIIEDAISISPNDPKVNFIKAKLALLDKDIETAIISLRVVTKEAPENIEAFLLLVNAYQLEANKEQVRATLNSAYENNKTNPDALLKLAQYYSSVDLVQSEKMIDEYNLLKQKDYEGLSIKAAILNQNKEQEEAYKIAETLMSSFADKPNGYIQAVPYLAQQGDNQKVISILENGYMNTKDNRKLLVLLTSVQVSEKKFDIAEQRLKAEIKASPDDAELKLLLAKVYLVKKDNDSATTLLNDVIKLNPGIEEPYLLLAEIYQSNKDTASAYSILINGKTNIVASIKIPLRLAVVYELDGKYKESIEIYRELYESNPDNLVIVNNLASLLSDYGNSDADLKLASTLSEKLEKSGQPVFLDTVGWVYYKQDDYKNAVKFSTQVVEKMPDVNVFNYHLGMAYKKAGDSVNAKRYLEKSLADKKPFKEKAMAEAALKDL